MRCRLCLQNRRQLEPVVPHGRGAIRGNSASQFGIRAPGTAGRAGPPGPDAGAAFRRHAADNDSTDFRRCRARGDLAAATCCARRPQSTGGNQPSASARPRRAAVPSAGGSSPSPIWKDSRTPPWRRCCTCRARTPRCWRWPGPATTLSVRILQQLPAREAGQLERKMQQLGPLRLDDVERAQLRLAEVAQRLIDEGRIALPQVERFAVAA